MTLFLIFASVLVLITLAVLIASVWRESPAAWLYTQIGTPAAIDPSLNVAGSATDRDMPSMPELIAGLSLLEQAYALDARHEQTLWLLGVARQQAGRHVEALTLLGTLRAIASAGGNTEAVATIDQYAARSQAELGQPSGATSESASESASGTTSGADTDTNQPAPSADPGAPGVSLTVTVSLSDAATEELAPDTPVFVFARAANGPPMPLAVQRLTVADLPVTITLDETMAMIPNMTLAAFPEVIVGARASLSGQPTAASGDWSLELPVTIGKDASALLVHHQQQRWQS